MCKYGQYTYKTHFVCFSCRKGFKKERLRSLDLEKQSKCPECGGQMVVFGFDFKVPAIRETDQWKKVEYLYRHGYNFYSCGCGGPGYAPKNMAEAQILVSGVEEKKAIKQLTIQENFDRIAARTIARRKKLEKKRMNELIRKEAAKHG